PTSSSLLSLHDALPISMSLIDVGLQEQHYRDTLLEGWSNETKSQGEIRKALERDVWGRYGCGLWTETWGEFFGEFSRAVQPYAQDRKSTRLNSSHVKIS